MSAREANQQRVDAAAQRVRQAMTCLPTDHGLRKDVELLIEIALAPVLEIFAPAATPMEALFKAANTAAMNLETSMNLREHPQSCECYGCGLQRAVVNFALARAKENVRPIVERELQSERWPAAAQPQRESEKCATAPSAINSVVPPATGSTAATTTSPARIWRREPRPSETETPLFNAIWRVVKCWEIEQNGSRWSATGNDVCGIIDSIAEQRESEQPEQALREALERSMVALDDWLNIHASDHCDERRVKEARQRVNEHGTIHYIGTVQDRNRAALSPQTDSQEPR